MYALFPRLRERAANRANKLSGGEQQMLAIGRALMSNPDLCRGVPQCAPPETQAEWQAEWHAEWQAEWQAWWQAE